MGTSKSVKSKLNLKTFLFNNWPIFGIIIIWLIFCSPYFIKGLIPFPTKYLVTFFPPWNAQYFMPVKNNAMPDVITQIYPWKLLTINTWKSGAVPLWNPASFSGTVHAANYQSAVFTPLNLLFFILPFVDAWSVLILLQPLLAGWFTYLFLKELVQLKVAAFIGAISFMFCGFMTVWMAYGTLGYAILWLPLILWVILRQNRHVCWINNFIISLAIAISLLSGHFQISVYVILFSIFYVVYQMISSRKIKINLFLIINIFLGILLAAPQLWLTYKAYLESVRSTSFVKGEVIPWKYLITLLAPDFYGNPVTRNDWFGHYAEWSIYIGIVPILLAFYAFIKAKSQTLIFFGVTALLTLSLAYQTPLVDLLFALKIPVLSTSAASRIIILTSFSFVVLAAYGTAKIIEDWQQKNKSAFYILGLICGGILIALWATLMFLHPFPLDKLLVAKRNFLLPSIFIVISLIIFYLGFLSSKLTRFCLLILCLITVIDMNRFVSKWLPFEPREYIYPATPMLNYLNKISGNDRIFGNIGGEVGVTQNLPLIDGYDAMYQGKYGEFANAISDGTPFPLGRSVVVFSKNGTYIEPALELLGVKYFVHRLSDGNSPWAYPVWKYDPQVMKSVYRDSTYEIFEYMKALPRVFLTSKYQIVSDSDVIRTLLASDFDRKNILILPQKPSAEPEAGIGDAKITSYKSNQVEINTNTTGRKLLFLSDVYNTGWKAYVDNKITSIYRADYDFRAVSVPSGNHKIKFIYAPDEFTSGIKISVISLILILGISIYIFYENRYC
jgi:hypothetical protein